MPANNQTDTDAGAQSVVGTDQVDQVSRALHQVRPNWAEDGHGVRGPQRPVIPAQLARPNPVEFEFPASSPSTRGSAGLVVTTEDASGYTPGTGISTLTNVSILTFDQDVFELFDGGGGQAVIRLKTTTC